MKLRRVLALVMALCLLVGQLPATAWATENEMPYTPGTAYKLKMDQKNNGTVLYFNGATETATVTYRLGCTQDVATAADVYLEQVEGGYLLYFMNGETKTYIRVYERTDGAANAGKASLELTTAVPTEYFTYDSSYDTLIYVADADNSYYMGTYATYSTITASNMTYLSADNVDVSQFPARLCVVVSNPAEPEETTAPTEATEPEETTAPTEPTEPEETTESTEPADTESGNVLSIAEAVALGESRAHNSYTVEKYYVTGEIISITNSTYGNMHIADESGNSIYIYGTYNADGTVRFDALDPQPAVGDTVTVYGIIGQYNGLAQMKNGWITEHLISENGGSTGSADPEADSVLSVAEAASLGVSKLHDTYTEGKYYVTGEIVSIVAGTSGNMHIADESGNTLFIYSSYSADGTVRFDALSPLPAVGDTITVYGIIGQYNNLAQMKNGWITEHVVSEDSVVTESTDPEADSVLSVTEAAALAASKLHGVYTEGKYYVTGEITGITDTTNGILHIADGDGNTLYIYNSYNADGTAQFNAMDPQPAVGDTVTVYGVLGRHYSNIQMKNAWITEHVAAEGEGSNVCGENLTWSLENGVLTISGAGAMTDYDNNGAPWYGETITEVIFDISGAATIGKNAFSGCTGLTTVTLPEGIVSINQRAFVGCTNLASVTLPESLTTIGQGAFRDCTALTTVTIPAGVSNLDSFAFGFCTNLAEIVIAEGNAYYCNDEAGVVYNKAMTRVVKAAPKGISGEYTVAETATAIGSNAFNGCVDLTAIVLHEGITGIGASAFRNCTSLVRVVVPAGVTVIESATFENCEALQCIELPESVTQIEDYAFYYCYALTDIALPSGLTAIGNYVFSDCTSLAQLAIPEGVTSIGKYAFSKCYSLTEIVIPQNVTQIGWRAFYQCTGLSKIYFQGALPTIDEAAFEGVTAEAFYPEGDTTWTEEALQNYGGTLTWVAYQEATEVVDAGTCGENATWTLDANGLLTISGTGEMTDYGNEAGKYSPFKGNDAIRKIVIEEGITRIGLYTFFECAALTEVVLPEGLETIAEYGFYNCTSLPSISFPESLTSIGSWTFYGCSSLAGITFPENLCTIGDRAFAYCTGLAGDLTIPGSVTYVGIAAFRECTGLNGKVIIEAGAAKTIKDAAFYICKNLTGVELGNGITTIGQGAFGYCTGLKGDLVIPDSVTCIATMAFVGCSGFDGTLTLSTNLTELHTSAFWGCNGFTGELVIPDTLTKISEGVFAGMTGITSLVVGEKVNSIFVYSQNYPKEEHNAFYGMTGVTEVIFTGKNVPTVYNESTTAYSPFQYMTSLETVYVPADAYGDYAAAYKTHLPNTVRIKSIGATEDFQIDDGVLTAYLGEGGAVVIPHEVTEIGAYAFLNCAELTKVTILSGVTAIGSNAFSSCTGLSEIRFRGDAPVMEAAESVFENVTATVYYPEGNETWTEDVMLQYGGTLTWVAYDPIFALSGASVSLGDSLDMSFFLESPNVDAGCYAVITRSYADGRENHAVTVPYSEWNALEDGTIYVTYGNIAAKEMGDTISVVIYNAEGEAISTQWDDSVKAYAMRMLEKTEDAKLRTLLVDMLNYGAAAQSQFGYDTANLVNAGLTDEQKGFATASYETESNLISGTGRAGTSLTLKSRITLDFIFKNTAIGTDYTGLYAIAAYTDHYGNEIETRIDTVKVFNANLGYVSVPGLAVADYGQAVTCTVYDAEGNILAWATDSMEGYAHRMKGSLPNIVEAIVKFGNSSYNYFH